MTPSTASPSSLCRRHLIEGWGGLFLYACLGLSLEALLAFKAPIYIDVENDTRRLMWRLAHAHGTLFSLLHLGLAFTFTKVRERSFPQPAGLLSGCLTAASLLIPAGFFLAGLRAHDGDPGSAIALVPAGAVALLVALGLAFRESLRSPYMGPGTPREKKHAEE